MTPLAARGAAMDVDADVDLRARALEIMRDERGADDDANRRSSEIPAVASDAFDDDELDEIDLAQARVLMRDLPRVLARLEGETTVSGRAEDGAAPRERDAERDAGERDDGGGGDGVDLGFGGFDHGIDEAIVVEAGDDADGFASA